MCDQKVGVLFDVININPCRINSVEWTHEWIQVVVTDCGMSIQINRCVFVLQGVMWFVRRSVPASPI